MSSIMYLLIIGGFILYDWFYIEQKDIEPNKLLMWSIRVVVTILFALLAKSFNLIDSLLYVGFLAFLFYALFDYGLNLARGKPFFHKGKNWIDGIIPGGIYDLSFKILSTGMMYIVYQNQFFQCLNIGLLESGFWRDVKYCMGLMI